MTVDTTPSAAGNADTSVIIVSYRTGPTLFHAIATSLAQEGVGEVVVVDQGNPDDVLAELRRLSAGEPRLTLLTGHGNIGFGRGCNLGARNARGHFLLFVNPDAMLPPGAVARLREERLRHAGAVLLAPKLVDVDGREQRGSRRADITPATAVVEALRLYDLAPGLFPRVNLHEAAPLTAPAPIEVASGACLFVSVGDFQAIGGFDPGYFLHVEDVDLCLRFRQAGGIVLHVPSVEVRHVGGTSDSPPLRVEYYKAVSFTRYFRTHFRDRHSRLLLAAVVVLVWLRFALRAPLILWRGFRARTKRDARADHVKQGAP